MYLINPELLIHRLDNGYMDVNEKHSFCQQHFARTSYIKIDLIYPSFWVNAVSID